MKKLKKISRKELIKIEGGYVPVEGGGNECVLNWVKCPGQGLARVGTAQQGLVCC